MITVLLIVIAVVLILLLVQSGKRTASVQRLERKIDSTLPAEVFSPAVLAAAGKPGFQGMIEAIKQYRSETGAGLDEAKPKIEALRADLGVS